MDEINTSRLLAANKTAHQSGRGPKGG